MVPNLYSQTPGAFSMGPGQAGLASYTDPIYGNIFGPSRFGDRIGSFAAGAPSMIANAGTAAAIASGFGLGGTGLRTFGNIAGLGALPLAAGLPLHLAASAALSQFKVGADQQLFSQGALQRALGDRDAGGRMGFGASRTAAGEFASMFRELSASANMLTGDQELKNLFNKFNDMSLFQTVRDAKEVGTRFKKLAETVRDISRDLGTTLEGALPMFRQHVQMGFVDPDQIRSSMRASRAVRGVGVGSSEATVTGLQMAQSAANFAAGGTRREGALGATRTLGMVNIALEQGLLSDEDLMSATGQIGERGASDLAQQFMQASRNVMTNSTYGKMLSAFLGETDKGKFTGRLDQSALRRLRNISSEDLMSEASAKIDKGGLSFMTAMESGLGADIASQLGTGDLTQLLDKIFTEEEAHSEEMKQLVLKRMTGLRGQTVKQLLKLSKQTQRIEADYAQQMTQRMLRNRLPSLIEERFSIGGQLDRLYRSAIKDPILRPIQEAGGQMVTYAGQEMDNLIEDFIAGGAMGGINSLIMGRFGRRRGGPSSTIASRRQAAFQAMFDDDLDISEEALTADRYEMLDSGTQEAIDRISGSRNSSRAGEMEKRMENDLGAATRFRELINKGKAMNLTGQDLFRFITSDENLAEIQGVSDFAYTRQDRTMSGGIMGMLSGLEKNKGLDYRMLDQISSLKQSARDRRATLLSAEGVFGGNLEDQLLGTGKDVIGRTGRGIVAGATTGAFTSGFVGALGGALVGGLMAGAGALIDDSGEGMFATGGGEFDGDQIESDFLRGQVQNNKANARAILEALSDETFLANYILLDSDEDKIKSLSSRGVKINKDGLEEIDRLIQQIVVDEGDGNIRKGLEEVKGTLGKASSMLKKSIIRDHSKRMNKLFSATLESKLSGQKGGKELTESLRGALRGRGVGDLFGIENREQLIDSIGGQEGVAIQNFMDLITVDGDLASAEELAQKLTSLEGVTQKDKDKILRLGKENNIEELTQLALRTSTANMQNLEETSSVKAVKRLQGAEEFADLMLDLNSQLSAQLGTTQEKTIEFSEKMGDAIKKVEERIP